MSSTDIFILYEYVWYVFYDEHPCFESVPAAPP